MNPLDPPKEPESPAAPSPEPTTPVAPETTPPVTPAATPTDPTPTVPPSPEPAPISTPQPTSAPEPTVTPQPPITPAVSAPLADEPAVAPTATTGVVVSGGDPQFTAAQAPAPKKKSKLKLILLIVLPILLIGLAVGGFFGYKTFAKSQDKKNARKTADTFVEAFMAGDVDKLKSVYMHAEEIEDSAFGGGEQIFESSEFKEFKYEEKSGKLEVAAAYKLKLKKPLATFTHFDLAFSLEKHEGKWMVNEAMAIPSQANSNVSASSFDQDSVAENGKDTEREADIRALQANIETYFNKHDKYPTLAELNNAQWRSANITLDEEAFKDPDGSSSQLASKPAKNVYSYELKGTKYTLTATKSDGTTFVKASVN